MHFSLTGRFVPGQQLVPPPGANDIEWDWEGNHITEAWWTRDGQRMDRIPLRAESKEFQFDFPGAPGAPPVVAQGKTTIKCSGECKRTFYYKIAKITLTAINDSSGSRVTEKDEKYGVLSAEVEKRQMIKKLQNRLETEGETSGVDCKEGCTCRLPKLTWTDDEKKGKARGNDSHSVTERVASQNGDVTWEFSVEFTARKEVSGKCEQ